MSNTVNYLVTDRTLTFYVGGQPYAIDRESRVFNDVVAELNKPDRDPAELVRLADTVKAIQKDIARLSQNPKTVNYLPKGVINVTRDGVTFDGEPFENALTERLMDILALGLRLGPWIRFAENVFMNPAEYAREELYEWLSKSDLPITDDGCFLAYKRVRSDFKDIHSGSFDNSVGQVVQLAGRENVDPNRLNLCSTGLHFCSKEYLPHFGSGSGNKVVLLKINPADVVSIPADYDNTKGRTWRYEVVDEVDVEGITDIEWAPISYDYSDIEDEEADYDGWEDEEDDYDGWEAEAYAEKEELYNAEVAKLVTEGIVNLRRQASHAGLNSTQAWKVFNIQQLASFIATKKVYG